MARVIREISTNNTSNFVSTTNDIKITVKPHYLDNESEPEKAHYAFAYHVKIENHKETPVKLLGRKWNITDSKGMTSTIVGDGVVGKQPVIYPNSSFEYASGTNLMEPSGVMSGEYIMEDIELDDKFEANIPLFSLDSDIQKSMPN